MNDITVLISSNHPLKDGLDSSKYNIIPLDPYDFESLSGNDLESTHYLIDLTCFPSETKRDLLGRLDDIYQGIIISDLTINWVDYIFRENKNVHCAIAASFYSPTNKCELAFNEDVNQEYKQGILSALDELGIQTKEVKHPGICFNYPRIISQIINEAYFAKEEDLASENDIDKAMRYGVNYPLGPFEWAKKIGRDKVALVLRELANVTGDPRYRMSLYLKEEII